MKNLKKKLIVLIMTAVMVSAMTVGASAAYVTYGVPCPGSSSSSNSCSGNSSGGNSNCTLGDVNSILGCLNNGTNCPQSYCKTDGNSSAVAGASYGGNSVYNAVQSYINAARQNSNCPTAGNTQNCGGSTCATSSGSACPASSGSACPEAGGGSCPAANGSSCYATNGSACLTSNGGAGTAGTPAPAAKNTSAPAATSTPAANSASNTAADATPADTAESESAAAAQTETEAAADNTASAPAGLISYTGTTVDEGTLAKLLDGILSECGSYLSKIGIYLPASDPAVAVTPQPTDNGGTETPATPQPTDSGASQTNNDADNLSFEEQVVTLVNEQRAANGLAPLTLNTELSNAARLKSQDMHDNNYFSHTSPTYGSPFDMLKSFGISYRAAGENIAMGYATPEAVMNAWMNSSGHRANILNSSYTQIGVGYVANGNYWTQEFIG